MKKDTLIIKSGLISNGYNGAINPPIYHLSTILFPTLQDYRDAQKGNSMHKGCYNDRDCSYGTVGSQTAAELGKALSALETENSQEYDKENRCKTLLYPSGLVALTLAAITFSESGKHILVSDNSYGPFRRFLEQDLIRMGVEVTFYNPEEKLDSLIKENTSLIMMESPGSITFEIADIEKIVTLAKKHNIVTVMDNTWATPLFFKPLEQGIDVSLYAATKYINGHSDVLMGVAHAKSKIFDLLYNTHKNYGIAINSQDCYLVQRGLRTLSLRVDRHQSNAMKVATYLETVPEVKKVLYPALPSFNQYQLWKKYYTGATALFSIILDKKYSDQQLGSMINHMNFFGIGASWGGYKSLILSFDLEKYHRNFNKYDTGCIRIFCGLEDPEDLIEDLKNAFIRLRKAC
ncbi:MAG: PLP-dependent transferase [Rickettsiaceae bacterium H1]|nr:PLP-dependent transferase [Rickettsiaceae bacterium H1]